MTKNIMFPCVAIYLLLMMIIDSSKATPSYNVQRYGARGDGQTDSTKAFHTAWSMACRSRTSAMVYVPRGTYLVKNLVFLGPCRSRITFKIDGTLVAPTNYWDLGSSGYWILFAKVNRISVYGGTVDARGAGYWACRRKGGHCPPATRSISFSWCNDVLLSGFTSVNSHNIHVSVHHSTNVRIRDIKIRAPSGSPNTDGIHVQSSTGITISGGAILTGDDCISLSQGSRNVWIERVNCGPGHGISIGSLGDYVNEEGVQNVTVTSSVFTKTQNGVRIKSWARASNGYARNIVFRNLVMNNVQNPLIIDQNYCPSGKGCPHQSSGVKISGVTYSNIKGTTATAVGVKLDCSPRNPCTGIVLQDIKLTYMRRSSSSYCRHVHGRSSGVVIPRNCL
ncbi:PREDICTED: polygalacturonase [Tarenaya hassleriana]|uniref:polygalacturonase n=1 Tax=Tarenaya hassleriana TaxID=28532 RepID=UPI00053CA506|nr:PREDICTED: polygalacturonase [Tarenaya hassleriana]